MSDVADSSKGGGRRRKRQLTVEEKYEIYLGLVTGMMTQSEAADRHMAWTVPRLLGSG